VPDLITNGVDGFMESVGDTEAQARRISQLLTDEHLRNRMAAAGRQTAESRFCSSRIIPQYESFYRQILDSTG
jgi:glycosyltransferase involved in cell wall biosynthesis